MIKGEEEEPGDKVLVSECQKYKSPKQVKKKSIYVAVMLSDIALLIF